MKVDIKSKKVGATVKSRSDGNRSIEFRYDGKVIIVLDHVKEPIHK